MPGLMAGRADDRPPTSDSPEAHADAQLARIKMATWSGNVGEAASLARVEAQVVATRDPRRAAALALEGAVAALQAGDMRVAAADARRVAAKAGPWPELCRTARQVLAVAEVAMAVPGSAAGLDAVAASCGPAFDDPSGVAPFIGAVRLWQGDLVGARWLLTQQVAAARERYRAALPFTLGLMAELERRTGAWDAGMRGAIEGLELAQSTGSRNAEALLLAQLARFDLSVGREELGTQRLADATTLGRLGGITLIGYLAAALRGEVALRRGDVDAAIGELRVARDLSHRAGLRHPGFVSGAPDLIEALARAGLRDEARAALDDLEADTTASGCPAPLAGLDRARVALASDDELDGIASNAELHHHQMPIPFERARTLALLGNRRRRSGDRRNARLELAEAVAQFRFLGAWSWVERTAAELRAAGGRTDAARPDLVEGLTQQEREVAHLVAAGASNREAAATLFLSVKTIERHLTNSYRKLGLRSRTELAAWLRRTDPIDPPSA